MRESAASLPLGTKEKRRQWRRFSFWVFALAYGPVISQVSVNTPPELVAKDPYSSMTM